jgi:hypothetical protein
MYTLDDLEAAREESRHWGDAFANDRSNNPNKYEAQQRDASIKIRRIERYLKDHGIIEKTERELLNEELDKRYPNAKSKTIVTYQGKRYQIRYSPLVQSRSRKTVKEWGHNWEQVQ